MDRDLEHLRHAILLARETQRAGNFPVGAVIVLDGEVVAEGQNKVWIPTPCPHRHAEIDALETIPSELRARAPAMTLYTTLEPCLICLSALLVHRIGRVVFGSSDGRGGASYSFGHLPPAFERLLQGLEWTGPALPQECNELREETFVMVAEYNKRIWGSG